MGALARTVPEIRSIKVEKQAFFKKSKFEGTEIIRRPLSPQPAGSVGHGYFFGKLDPFSFKMSSSKAHCVASGFSYKFPKIQKPHFFTKCSKIGKIHGRKTTPRRTKRSTPLDSA